MIAGNILELNNIDKLFEYFIQIESKNRILIGGQALFVYAIYYSNDINLQDLERSAVKSKDLDFASNSDTAQQDYTNFKELLKQDYPDDSWFLDNIYFKKPSAFESTPNAAVIVINPDSDSPILIDYLSHIAGVSDGQLAKNKSRLEFKGISIPLLSPINLLRSRTANYFELGYGADKKERESIRLGVVSRILGAYISDAINAGEIKIARTLIQDIYREACRSNCQKLYTQIGFDPTTNLPETDPRLGADFIDKNLPLIKGKLQDKRKPITQRISHSLKI